jgi:hypothetical protein
VEGQCGSSARRKLDYVWKVKWDHGLSERSEGSEGEGSDASGREDG